MQGTSSYNSGRSHHETVSAQFRPASWAKGIADLIVLPIVLGRRRGPMRPAARSIDVALRTRERERSPSGRIQTKRTVS